MNKPSKSTEPAQSNSTLSKHDAAANEAANTVTKNTGSHVKQLRAARLAQATIANKGA